MLFGGRPQTAAERILVVGRRDLLAVDTVGAAVDRSVPEHHVLLVGGLLVRRQTIPPADPFVAAAGSSVAGIGSEGNSGIPATGLTAAAADSVAGYSYGAADSAASDVADYRVAEDRLRVECWLVALSARVAQQVLVQLAEWRRVLRPLRRFLPYWLFARSTTPS